MKKRENETKDWEKEEFRECSKCKEVKDTTNFYYCKTNNNYQSHCRQCVLNQKKQRYQQDDAFREGRKSYQIVYNKAKRLLAKWECD